MTESLTETVRYGVALLLLVLLPRGRRRGEGAARVSRWLLPGGAVGGLVLALLYERLGLRASLEGIVMLAVVPCLLALLALLPGGGVAGRRAALAWGGAAILLVAQRLAALGSYVVEKSRDREKVLDSDFLLFFGGILLGGALLATLGAMLSRMADRGGRARTIASGAAILLLSFEHLSWGAYAMVQQGWIGVPDALFSPFTMVVNHLRWLSVAEMALAVAFGLFDLATRKKAKDKPDEERLRSLGPAARRMELSGVARQRRQGFVFLGAALLTAALTAYHAFWASRPLSRTPAETVRAVGGRVVIPLQHLEAGGFRRYALEEGGRQIRFFVLRDAETRTVRAAYDACLMCGDEGYLMRGKDLICIACGAAIYAPTVGRGGGCNPIPLVYSLSGESLVVTAEALTGGEGAELFAARPAEAR